MNAYEVLQVPPNATADEIKAAYRRAVKEYHPDVSRHGDNQTIALVNQAYDLLSDPIKRKAYDNELYSAYDHPSENDPNEAYRQSYIRKKREEAEAQKMFKKRIYKNLRVINILITIVACLLVVDEFLPTFSRTEYGVREWTMVRRVKRSTYYIHFFQTNTFTLTVPNVTQFSYDFKRPAPITIKSSPIFRIPMEVRLAQGTGQVIFEPSRTIYSFAFPFHYLLLFSCALTFTPKTIFSYGIFAKLCSLALLTAYLGYV